MKKLIFIATFVFGHLPRITNAQTIDTLVDVGGGNQIHFTIIKGKGAPILFESGAGNNGSIWKDITKQIANVTGATIITYDRLGFGQNSHSTPIGFGNEIIALEVGLKKLGFANKNIMLVSHSLGGLYNSYYASRHSNEVKAVVLIEASTVCAMTSYLNNPEFAAKDGNVANDIRAIRDSVSKHPMPKNIPIIEIVAEHQYDDNGNMDTTDDQMWRNCHKNFIAESAQRKILIAYGTGHYIFIDNPSLAINVIVTQYANYLEPKQKTLILEKGNELALTMLNESKKKEVKCGHSEDDLNLWAYSLLEKKETEKAIEIFKLNVTFNPDSWNAYDSLAEGYLKAGNKELAKKNYKKSLELNPKNDNATKVLEEIK